MSATAPSARIRTTIWLGLLALVLTAITGGVWTALLVGNLALTPALPWAVVVMGLLLWLLWRYLSGAWWPHRTSEARRMSLRARSVAAPVFTLAIVAGALSIVALAGLWIALFQVAGLPTRTLPDYSRYPFITIALALLMASLVNAVAEEALFRGYFQGALEGLVGGAGAIALTALVMAPEHALTQGFVWPVFLFYLAVDVMLGVTAYLTQSILPGIVTHSLGLLAFFTLVWPGDLLRQWVGQGDTTTWLWIHVAQALIFGALATLVFLWLARSTKTLRQTPGKLR